MISDPSYFTRLAAYNIWANDKLYSAVSGLSNAERERDLGAFFGSIYRTLSHIYVADAIWMGRLTGTAYAVQKLDHAPFDGFANLRTGRKEMDAHIAAIMARFAGQDMAELFSYKDIAGVARSVPLGIALGHVFNHQTHHRGHVHAMLSQLGKEPPALDLIYYQLELSGA